MYASYICALRSGGLCLWDGRGGGVCVAALLWGERCVMCLLTVWTPPSSLSLSLPVGPTTKRSLVLPSPPPPSTSVYTYRQYICMYVCQSRRPPPLPPLANAVSPKWRWSLMPFTTPLRYASTRKGNTRTRHSRTHTHRGMCAFRAGSAPAVRRAVVKAGRL